MDRATDRMRCYRIAGNFRCYKISLIVPNLVKTKFSQFLISRYRYIELLKWLDRESQFNFSPVDVYAIIHITYRSQPVTAVSTNITSKQWHYYGTQNTQRRHFALTACAGDRHMYIMLKNSQIRPYQINYSYIIQGIKKNWGRE